MKKIIAIVLLVMIIPIGIISWKYNKYKNELYQKEPHFDLFIAKSLYKKDNDFPWREFWNNCWNDVQKKDKRQVKWISSLKEFEKLDSIYLGLKNTSNKKFYYVTWGEPNSRVRISYTVFKNRKVDSIPFGGFGCGTGIYITPLKNGKTAGSKFLNPLMFNPFTNYPLPLKNKKFPQLFKEIYGDSVLINFEQATYSLPWNKTPSQMIKSDGITISTDKVIENWKKEDFRVMPDFVEQGFEHRNQQAFYIKKGEDIELSSLFEETK